MRITLKVSTSFADTIRPSFVPLDPRGTIFADAFAKVVLLKNYAGDQAVPICKHLDECFTTASSSRIYLALRPDRVIVDVEKLYREEVK